MDADVIRGQVERIVASEPFRKSNRYPRLLKFIVDQTLAGNADHLKERTLGIGVFDRAPDYELKTDPIVRVAAGELRKRLAQYYIQNDSENELRIELHPGSYIPEFRWPQQNSNASTIVAPGQAADLPASTQVETEEKPNYKRRGALLFALLFSVVLAVVSIHKVTSRPSASEKFWGPILKANASPMICVGDVQDFLLNFPNVSPTNSPDIEYRNWSMILDVNIANSFSEILAAHGKRVFVQNSSRTTLDELGRQPVILIGWRNNRWSQRAVQLLRFRLGNTIGHDTRTIVDTQNSSQPRWMVPKDLQFGGTGETYALIARFEDPATGQPTVLIAGIGIAGGLAAASYITNDHFLQTLFRDAPRGWENKNIELVIETHVINGINGSNGPPHLVASYVW